MTTTTLSDRESLETIAAGSGSLLGSLQGDLVLRMTNGPHAGRVVRLSSTKCSIGSAADCTLRLRGAGLDPVHCVILRGSRQTIVRRWSGDTRLNDRGFDDMPLHQGDRLTVGSIEMQVVAVPGEVREAAQAARRLDLELSAATGRLERLTERLDLSNRQGRRRLRSVLAKLRKYQLRLNEVDGRRSRLTQEQDELTVERARLQAAQQLLETQRGELEQEARRLAEREGNFAARRAELDRSAAQLLEREADLTTRARELTDRTTAMAAERARLQAAHIDFEQQRAAAELESRRLAALDAEQVARRTELDRRTRDLDAQQGDLESREKNLTIRFAKLSDAELSLNERESTLARRISDLQQQADVMTRRESEVAARCEALKNHWTVLTERETTLERDRASLTEQAGRLERERTIVAEQGAQVQRDCTKLAEGQAQLEQDRTTLAEGQSQLEQDRTALAEGQTQLERERTALSEQASRLQHERASLTDGQTQLERDRTAVAEQSELLNRDRTLLADGQTQLERDRIAVAEQSERLHRDRALLSEGQIQLERDRADLSAERLALAAQPVAAPAPITITETKVVVDTAAVERAEQLQVALSEARAEIAALQTQQADREAELRAEKLAIEEAQAAEKLDLSDRRAAVEAEAADLTARRGIVELAARTVQRWSALVEEWSMAEPIVAEEPVAESAPVEPAPVVAMNDEMAAALEQAEQCLLNDRLEIEKLGAELKTWRDEAQFWKTRFDEMSIAPPQAATVPAPTETIEVEANRIEANEIASVSAEEPIAAAAEQIEQPEPEATLESIAEPIGEPSAIEAAAVASSYDTAEDEITDTGEEPVAEEDSYEEPVAETVEDEPVATQEVQSESAADVLRRMGLSAALEDDAETPAAAQNRMRPTPPPAPKPAAAEHHEGEESLDAYMQQLFQRLGVNQAAVPAPEAKPQPAKPTASSAPSRVEESTQAEKPTAPAVPLPLLQPGEFKARSSAAERRSDLSALRELANFQAKTAITKNQISRSASKSKGKQTIGLTSLAIALCSGYFYFVQGFDYALYGMFACVGVAVLLLMQSLRFKLSAKKSARSLDDVIQKTAERGATKEVGAE